MNTKLSLNFYEDELVSNLCLLQVLKGIIEEKRYAGITVNAKKNKKWFELFDLPGLEITDNDEKIQTDLKTPIEIRNSGNSLLLKKHYSILLQAKAQKLSLKKDIQNEKPIFSGGYILLVPYAQEENTAWKQNYWNKLAEELCKSGHKVVVLNETNINITNPLIVHFETNEPTEIVNLFTNATLSITNNSKYAHLGGTLNAKTIVLISQQNPAEVFDYPSLEYVIPDVWCTGCNFRPDKGFISSCEKSCWALHTIMPTVVLARALKFLQPEVKMSTQIKPKLLAVLELGAPTGFATVGESLLHTLHQKFNLLAMAINYNEKNRQNERPYRIIRANMSGNDYLGLSTLPGVITEFKPEYVLLNNDAPVISNWIKIIENTCNQFNITLPRYCSYLPVDGEIFKPSDFFYLLEKGNLISYTTYGARLITQELKKTNSSYSENLLKRISIAPHCVDHLTYFPINTDEARRTLNASNCNEKDNGYALTLNQDDFVVGWINRNQPRKNLSSALYAFSKFCREKNNAKLLIRASISDYGGDFSEMIKYLGIEKKVFLISNSISNKQVLNSAYNSINVFLSTSIAEGWGLTEHEAAACSKPLVLPDNTVRKDLWGDCASLVPCSTPILNPAMCSSLGWLPDIDAIVKVLDYYYKHPESQKSDGERCYERALSFGTWQQTSEKICSQILA